MIREDRELLSEMASVNTDVVPLAMRIIDEIATAEEQHEFAKRLVALGQRLHCRAEDTERVVIEGTVLSARPVGVQVIESSHTNSQVGSLASGRG